MTGLPIASIKKNKYLTNAVLAFQIEQEFMALDLLAYKSTVVTTLLNKWLLINLRGNDVR